MSVIRAELTDPDKVSLTVTITANMGEWKTLAGLIVAAKHEPGVTSYGTYQEPFWSLVHRLGEIIGKISQQQSNYE
jgi:hypothetical protein